VENGIESTIIGFEEESCFIDGSISIEEIEAVCVLKIQIHKGEAPLLLVCFQNIMHPKLKLFYQKLLLKI
jgi:hypothetical protein